MPYISPNSSKTSKLVELGVGDRQGTPRVPKANANFEYKSLADETSRWTTDWSDDHDSYPITGPAKRIIKPITLVMTGKIARDRSVNRSPVSQLATAMTAAYWDL